RLLTGAWGTLGIVTEATLRLRARPERDVTLLAPVAADTASVAAVTTALRSLPFTAYAAELADAALMQRTALGTRPALLVRLGGSEAVVRAQRDRLMQALGPLLRGPIAEAPEEAWSALRGAEFPGATAVRFSAPPGAFASTWDEATYVGARVPGSVVCGSPLRGVVRASLPGDDSSLRPALSAKRGGTASCARVYERLPDALWSKFAPSAVADRLSQQLKRAFDPHGVLNPGILGD
ncbi:MAG TPA: hypothetical protein VNS52_02615, partial [Gemmatimonadaceae bacterium]|nr:hypothetical protein [Gemmatimonadaceae bacterium]